MHTMHPTVLVGPADWSAATLPQSEYQGRLDRLWQQMPEADGVLVYGSVYDHAALAYLTHLTPKLDHCLALLPRQGNPQMFIGGGPNMVPAAGPLSWVDAMAPIRDLAPALTAFKTSNPQGSLAVAGLNCMPSRIHDTVQQALGDYSRQSADAPLRQLMLRKSDLELDAHKRACVAVGAGLKALRTAHAQKHGVTVCVLAAERAAYAAGAQDVRTLFSLDNGLTLRPFERSLDETAETLQAYLAVRMDGYWAEAFCHLAPSPGDLAEGCRGLLDKAIKACRPGLGLKDISAMLKPDTRSFAAHPLCRSAAATSLGLALGEPDDGAPLPEGAVLSLRAGLSGSGAGAIVSAMVHLRDGRAELLLSPMEPLQ